MVHINIPAYNGDSFPVNLLGRYVRIQLNTSGTLRLNEIRIKGYREICGDGIDNDCDGKTDCDDLDCKPVILNISKIDPSCPACSDGKICVQANRANQISKDNGVNWLTFNPGQIFCFENLTVGSYTIKVRNYGYNFNCGDDFGNIQLTSRNPQNSCCLNGDFEYGDYTNWKGKSFRHNPLANPPVDILKSNFIDDINWLVPIFVLPGFDQHTNFAFQRMNSNTNNTDYFLGNRVDLFKGKKGSSIMRLGAQGANNIGAKMEYCFTVKNCNKIFRFDFLPVLHREVVLATHSESQQAYFQYKIIDKDNNNAEIFSRRITATSTDERFKNIEPPPFGAPGDPIRYTDWQCAAIDLSNYLDHNLCIEFEVRGCAFTDHLGYVYIDNLCKSEEDALPIIIHNNKQVYCKNEPVIIDFSQSNNYNRYVLELCEVLNGNPINCTTPIDQFAQIGKINFAELYIASGHTFECGKTYSAKITLLNDCSDPVSEIIVFQQSCDDPIVLNYDNFLNCEAGVDLQINGSILNCNQCQVNWTPAQYLNNPNIPNPKILGSLNVNAYNQKYTITATGSNGCSATKTIEVISLDLNMIHASIVNLESDICSFGFRATITTPKPTNRNDFEVTFINDLTNQEFIAHILGTDINSIHWIFETDPIDLTIIESSTWKVKVVFKSNNTNCTFYEVPVTEGNPLYKGGFPLAWPNVVFPYSTIEVNRYFWPAVVRDDIIDDEYRQRFGHNGYWARMHIFNRWGQELYDKTLEGTAKQPFDLNEMRWDCKYQGEYVPLETYMYVFEIRNCDYGPETKCCDDDFWSSGDCCESGRPRSEWCKCGAWKGTFTVIY